MNNQKVRASIEAARKGDSTQSVVTCIDAVRRNNKSMWGLPSGSGGRNMARNMARSLASFFKPVQVGE